MCFKIKSKEENRKKEKEIILPDEILTQYLDERTLQTFKKSNTGIFSITVVGKKQIL